MFKVSRKKKPFENICWYFELVVEGQKEKENLFENICWFLKQNAFLLLHKFRLFEEVVNKFKREKGTFIQVNFHFGDERVLIKRVRDENRFAELQKGISISQMNEC